MSDYIVHALYGILTEYGPSLLSTPRMFEAILSQKCKPSANETAALIATLRCGAVQDLWARPETDVSALLDPVTERSGLPTHTARWALEIWKRTLDHFRRGVAPPTCDIDNLKAPPYTEGPPSRMRTAVMATALIALVGTCSGALPGVLASLGVEHNFSPALRFRRVFEFHEPPGTHLSHREFALWIGGLGALGGLIGASLGWLATGFHHRDPTRAFFAVIGAIWAFDGAAFGAAHLGLVGTLLGSLFASGILTFAAALLGPIAVALLVKQLLWFVVPHF